MNNLVRVIGLPLLVEVARLVAMSAMDELWSVSSVGAVVAFSVAIMLAIYSWIGWRIGEAPNNKNISLVKVVIVFAIIAYVAGVVAIVIRAEVNGGITMSELAGSMGGLFVASLIYFPMGLLFAYLFKSWSTRRSLCV